MLKINKKITKYNKQTHPNKLNYYIVIHYVGSESTAQNNADYFYDNKLQASAHYFVDSDSIWQVVEDKDIAWHCGGGLQGSDGHLFFGRCKNSNSIGIEMCCFKDMSGRWFFTDATIKNTIELIKELMGKYNIPIDRVIRHYDVTGKNCPAPYVDETKWKEFKDMLIDKKIVEYTSANDIVWELGNRGIVTDKEGMLEELKEKPNGRLYWLARKFCHYIRERD